jgi:hypothetical protein
MIFIKKIDNDIFDTTSRKNNTKHFAGDKVHLKLMNAVDSNNMLE